MDLYTIDHKTHFAAASYNLVSAADDYARTADALEKIAHAKAVKAWFNFFHNTYCSFDLSEKCRKADEALRIAQDNAKAAKSLSVHVADTVRRSVPHFPN